MERTGQGVLPPIVAGLITALLVWATARMPVGPEASAEAMAWVVPLLLVFPFAVSGLWGWALLTGRPSRLVLAVAGGLLLVFLLWIPREIGWQAAVDIAAGLAAGLALGSRWRLDAGLGAVALCLAPLLIWSTLQMPIRQTLQEFQEPALETLEETQWSNLDDEQKAQAREREQERLDEAVLFMERVFPGMMAVGAIGQSGLILLLVYWLARLSGRRPGLRRIGPFVEWRLPFYLVWCLVAGVGLLLTRQPYVATAGLNLAWVAGLVICVQGLSVQAFFTSRLLSGPMQVAFWLIMGFPLFPMLLASSVVLGLADQWIDTRRLWLAREIDE